MCSRVKWDVLLYLQGRTTITGLEIEHVRSYVWERWYVLFLLGRTASAGRETNYISTYVLTVCMLNILCRLGTRERCCVFAGKNCKCWVRNWTRPFQISTGWSPAMTVSGENEIILNYCKLELHFNYIFFTII